LFHLQVVCHKQWHRLALQQQEKSVGIEAPRGTIFDRSGQLLASSLPADSVCVNPHLVKDISVASTMLAGVLHMDRQELYGKIQAAAAEHHGFLWVKRKISKEELANLSSCFNLDGVEYRSESQRFYPKGTLAAHVLGSVDFKETGNAGIEMSLDRRLRGSPGRMILISDVRKRGIESQIVTEPRIGENLALTIDERLQYVAERELKTAVETNGCKTGSLVAMNPQTGEILALANYPTFDPNDPAPKGTDPARFDLAVSVPFEPGSVFKVITLSAALETTNLKPETIIPCGSGRINLFGRIIKDHNSYVSLSMADVLAKSSNIGAIQIGLKVGPERLLDYVRRFGFGSRTEVPLPAEARGRVRDLAHWTKSSIGSVAMGHEVSTTTVQLARACSVVANGGLLVEPRIISWRQQPGAKPVVEPAGTPQRVLRPETTATMKQMMERVVLVGTGTKARLDGYTCGGKTGSAQIFDFETGHYTHKYNASFMGFAPLSNPAIVVVVTLNGASKYGGAVAAPVFRQVAMEALRLLDVPKDLPDEPSPRNHRSAPINDLSIADLSTPPSPETPVAESVLSAGVVYGPPGPEDALAALNVYGPKVPNFQGRTMRNVMEECLARGLPVEVFGSGIARAQAPAPGSILSPGARVRVTFVR
jgi:cell division protein FtsI (penicillin-binding protein 3)